MARRRVVVTGVGLVTPLAPTAPGTWARLLAGETAVRALTADDLPPEHAAALPHLPCRIGAPVDSALFAASPHAPAWLARPPPGATRAAAFAAAAAAEAVAAAGLDVSRIVPGRLAIAVGVGMPAVRDAAALGAALAAGRPPPPLAPARLLATGPASIVASTLGVAGAGGGPLDAPATACAAGASAVAEGAAAVARGDADVAVVGGAEACVDAVTIAGFCRMRALTTAFNDAPSHASRPFDVARSGFVVGEGAGVLVLEAESIAAARGAAPLAAFLGAGLSCDAHHAAQPPPDGRGAAAAMTAALAAAGVGVGDVGHVSAHATSTPAGDAAEAAALAALFGGRTISSSSHPAVSAVKSAVGHLLGAAGAVEAVLAVLALAGSVAPPTAALGEVGVPVDGFRLVGRDPVPLPAGRTAVSNSFGFGGGNVSLVFR